MSSEGQLLHSAPKPTGEGGPALVSPTAPRSPWQLLYGALHRARRRHWSRRARALPIPVVSVGNLHWGGGGKTPLVAAIAARLRESGRRPAILSRGWGRSPGGSGAEVEMVSDGVPGSPRLDAWAAGDEPALLARQLPEVPVLVGRDRHRAGLAALARLSPRPDVFLLDDGFSHLRLRRDLDLLALPAADPFGGGRLWPAGRLREPLAAAARAHAGILSGVHDTAAAPTGRDLARALAPHGFTGRGFVSATRAEPVRTFDGTPLRPGTRVLLVAGVASPERFAATAEEQGLAIVGRLFFADHHRYPAASLERIARRAAEHGAEAVVVTSKDAVKLSGRRDLPALTFAELPVRAEPEASFWSWLAESLESIGVEGVGAEAI